MPLPHPVPFLGQGCCVLPPCHLYDTDSFGPQCPDTSTGTKQPFLCYFSLQSALIFNFLGSVFYATVFYPHKGSPDFKRFQSSFPKGKHKLERNTQVHPVRCQGRWERGCTAPQRNSHCSVYDMIPVRSGERGRLRRNGSK